MKILNLVQGSAEWLAARAKYRTASEASAMAGASPYTSRSELLRQKATGDVPEVDANLQRLFDRGHAVEALARPLAEAHIGDELFPVTAVDDAGYLLASFDGLTMAEDICWECKLWNESKAAEVREGRVPMGDFWQVVQQLVVSGANKCLYTVTDGTADKTVHAWLKITDVEVGELMALWSQFDADLEAYVPAEVVPEVVGRSPDALPSLLVEVTGLVKSSNLDAFREHALAVFKGINTDLSTDEDFANADKTAKWCKEVEGKLEAAKDNALAQTATIDELFKAIDSIKEEARATRLNLERSVKARKESIRSEIINEATMALSTCLTEHTTSFNGEATLPVFRADFAGAMKGKRTIASLRNAVDTELARVKVEVAQIAAKIHTGLAVLRDASDGYERLFSDRQELVLLDEESIRSIARTRITDFEAEQVAKAAAATAAAMAKAEAAAATAAAMAKAEAAAESEDAFMAGAKKLAAAGIAPATASSPAAAAVPAPDPSPADMHMPTYGDLVRLIAKNYGVGTNVAASWLDQLTKSRAA